MATPYRSVWWENDISDWCVNTRNRDGSPRTIDDMLMMLRLQHTWRYNTSELHNWRGTASSGLTCVKCGSWCNNWHIPPKRGCTPARPELTTNLVGVAPRLAGYTENNNEDKT